MKLRYFAGIAGCIVVAAIWYFWDSGFFSRKGATADLVPQNAIFYAEQKDIGTLIDNVQNSHLGKNLAAINLPQIGRELGFPEDEVENLQKSLDTIKEISNNKLFREFCGKTVALALLPADTGPSPGISTLFPVKTLLITQPQHKAELLEMVSSVFSGNVQQTESKYGKFTIKRLQIDDVLVFAAIVDGYFLFSMDEQTLQHALDASKLADTSLARNSAYQNLMKQLPKSEFLIYCALDGLRQQLIKMVQQGTEDVQKQKLIESLESTSGLTYSAYGIWREKELLHDTSITLIDQTKLSPFLAQLFSIPPEHNDTLRFVPADILSYYWSNTFAPGSLWKMAEEQSKSANSEIDSFKSVFKGTTGREIPEVLALIDGGVSLLIKKGEPKAFIPLPHCAVFLKLKDRQSMEGILDKIVKEKRIPVQSQTYKQVTYSSYDLSLQAGMQAIYGFHENYLFFSNSSEMIQNIIDTIESGKGLQKEEVYTKMNLDLEKDSNSVSFFRMAEMLTGIKELLGWGGVMLAVQDRETAEKSRVVIDKLINPLLDGMSMFSMISTRSRLAKEQVIVESTMLLEPNKKMPSRSENK